MATVYHREPDGSRGVAVDMEAQARLGAANRPLREAREAALGRLREAREAALGRLREVCQRVAHPRIGGWGTAGGAHRYRR